MDYPKNYKAFIALVEATDAPPKSWSDELCSLWWEAKGNWGKAHNLIDVKESPTANRIHAYLHRKEGDDWNAQYWYGRANQSFPKISLKKELEQLIKIVVAKD
ncbi:MAG: hypothetical protein KJN75_01975 [Muriicola sp.]|nr:hypothetical protein [Muriicola sp.]